MKAALVVRSLRTIAKEIEHDWQKVSPYAKPYIDAMSELESIHDRYIYDTGKSVVLYFLANASSWRGETARRVKKELHAIVSH